MPMSSPQMTRIFGFFCSCFAISVSFHFFIFSHHLNRKKLFPFLLLLILFTWPSSSRRTRAWIAYPHWSILRNWMPASSSVRNAPVVAIFLHSFLGSVECTHISIPSEMQQTCLLDFGPIEASASILISIQHSSTSLLILLFI